jgi:hypothetical protein
MRMIASRFCLNGTLALALAALLAGCEPSGPTIVKNPDAPRVASGEPAAPTTPKVAPKQQGNKTVLGAPGALPPPG